MQDYQRLRGNEQRALDLIAAKGWQVVPFGLDTWANQSPRLGGKINATDYPLRFAPDAIADSARGIVLVEVIRADSGTDDGTRAVSLPKLVALWPWSLIAPCVVLDMADGGVWSFDGGWWGAVRGDVRGPRDQHKAYARMTREDDDGFADYWPCLGVTV